MEYDLNSVTPGVKYLTEGYIEYGQEVISGRALPDMYDGLKVVNRRILYIMKKDKITSNIKSARLCGDCLALHPHGESSVYQALVTMTDSNGSLAFPAISGTGFFGKVYSDDSAAASRYTEVKLNDNSNEYFGEMNGIEMVPNFDSTLKEPKVLPVSFPAVLVNSTEGIAVGFGTSIPSFNFNDVCDLVIECIQDGNCHTVIMPDFVTGGYYVRNDKELQKLMKVGQAKLKVRAKLITQDKKIICTEVPFGKTIKGLLNQIDKIQTSAIRNAYDTSDYMSGPGLTIDCASKSRVDEAMYQIFKDTDMQYTYSAHITVTKNGAPVECGVWKIVEDWVEWRKGVLRKEYEHQIEVNKKRERESKAIVEIVNSGNKKIEFVTTVAKKGRGAGADYLRDNFTREQVPADLYEFCTSRSLSVYHTGGSYVKELAEIEAENATLEGYLQDIGKVIIDEMKRLKATYGSSMKRRTEISTKDYEFVEDDTPKEKLVDMSTCTYECKNGFVRKTKYGSLDKTVDFTVDGVASDTLICIDNRGRIIRIYGEDLQYSSTDLGVYVPMYCGLDESDDYKILYMGKVNGDVLMVIYKDGTIGFVDTAEWVGNTRNVKVIEKGIAVSSVDNVGKILNMKDTDDMMFVTDQEGRVAWAYINEIKHKARTARTRVFNLHKNVPIDSYAFKNALDGLLYINNIGEYKNTLRFLESSEDFRGDVSDFTNLD